METNELTNLEIKQYSDFYSQWWGLKDGTLLSLDDPRGNMWVNIGDDVRTVEEYNDLGK